MTKEEKRFFCQMPFTHLHVHKSGLFTCCPPWIDRSCSVPGIHADLQKVWNGPEFVQLREAVLAGDDKYCYKCPLRPVQSTLRHNEPAEDEIPIMQRGPITINYSADPICNLSCPSCRVAPITVDWEEIPELRLKYVVDQFPDLQSLGVSLFGDPFASKQIREWLQESNKPPHVILWTNGLLIPKYWHTIKRIVTVISTSIDGASKPVYEKLRRGGKWEDIQKAVEFCKDMVADPKCSVQMLQYNYVVQTDNFRDMPAFVDWVAPMGTSKILFTPVDARLPISKAYWQHVNVANPDHPDHAEFVEVLKDPRLNHPIVDLLIDSDGTHPLCRIGPK